MGVPVLSPPRAAPGARKNAAAEVTAWGGGGGGGGGGLSLRVSYQHKIRLSRFQSCIAAVFRPARLFIYLSICPIASLFVYLFIWSVGYLLPLIATLLRGGKSLPEVRLWKSQM